MRSAELSAGYIRNFSHLQISHSYDAFDAAREQLVAANIILSKDAAPSMDLEPEYIAADNNKAYIALQEANAIAVLDLNTKQYDGIYSLGYKGFSMLMKR